MTNLTARELEIIRTVCDDPSGTLKDIAPLLKVTLNTLKNQLGTIERKTGTDSLRHLMFWAWLNGIAPCPCGKH